MRKGEDPNKIRGYWEFRDSYGMDAGRSGFRRVEFNALSGMLIPFPDCNKWPKDEDMANCLTKELQKKEGRDSEELKSLQRGADSSSRGSSNPKRLKKKRSSSVERVADVSQGEMGGSSKSHRVKKKRASFVERVADDASLVEIGGTSKSHRVKKKRASIVESGADASQGEIGGISKPHRVKNKGGKSRVQRAIDARAGGMVQGSEINPFFWALRNKAVSSRMRKFIKSADLRYAKQALKFYEKKKGASFEIVEVVYSELVNLVHPEYELDQGCVHVSFSAKPKIAGCSDTSSKYFFGELLETRPSMNYHAKYCSTFEPSDDPGFNHGCVFCPAGQKFHPATGYRVGRVPWTIKLSILRKTLGSFLDNGSDEEFAQDD